MDNPLRFIDPDGMGGDEDKVKKEKPKEEPKINTVIGRTGTSIAVVQMQGNKIINTSVLTGSKSNIGNVTNKSALEVGKLMVASGVKSAEVTSTNRTPEQEAQIMFEQPKINYASAGRKVIEVYNSYTSDKSCTKEETINAMKDKIIELGPFNVSTHDGEHPNLNVFDIGRKSVSNPDAFHNALETARKNGELEYSDKDRHNDPKSFHFEIKQ